jgi:hypothetical protein
VTAADLVEFILDEASLSSGEKRRLIAKLGAVADAGQLRNLTAACNQIDALVRHAQALMQSGQLDAVDAAMLVSGGPRREARTRLSCAPRAEDQVGRHRRS